MKKINLRKANIKKRSSIYRKLVISYVVFAILVVSLFAFCLVGVGLLTARGNMKNLMPYTIVNEDSLNSALPAVRNMGGWVESISEEAGLYQINDSYGNKKTDAESYTLEQLQQLTNINSNTAVAYIGFLNKRTDDEGYYFVQYKHGDVAVKMEFQLSNESENPVWYKVFFIVFLTLFAGLSSLMGYYLSKRIKKKTM